MFISNNENKPVKIVLENNYSYRTEIYHLPLKDVLRNELRWNYELRRNLTKQQIHTEYGKLKRGRINEIINFLVKRGITKEYIENEVNQERENVVVSIPIKLTDIVDCKFGIYQMK
jgi:uncharacterized protein related to proFAR isomerase